MTSDAMAASSIGLGQQRGTFIPVVYTMVCMLWYTAGQCKVRNSKHLKFDSYIHRQPVQIDQERKLDTTHPPGMPETRVQCPFRAGVVYLV